MHPIQATEFIACAELQHQERVGKGERSRMVGKPQRRARSHGTWAGFVTSASWLAVAALLMALLVVAGV